MPKQRQSFFATYRRAGDVGVVYKIHRSPFEPVAMSPNTRSRKVFLVPGTRVDTPQLKRRPGITRGDTPRPGYGVKVCDVHLPERRVIPESPPHVYLEETSDEEATKELPQPPVIAHDEPDPPRFCTPACKQKVIELAQAVAHDYLNHVLSAKINLLKEDMPKYITKAHVNAKLNKLEAFAEVAAAQPYASHSNSSDVYTQ